MDRWQCELLAMSWVVAMLLLGLLAWHKHVEALQFSALQTTPTATSTPELARPALTPPVRILSLTLSYETPTPTVTPVVNCELWVRPETPPAPGVPTSCPPQYECITSDGRYCTPTPYTQ